MVITLFIVGVLTTVAGIGGSLIVLALSSYLED